MKNHQALVAGLVCVAAALVFLFPSFVWGPSTYDSGPLNYVWTKQFGEALGRGELYPRWLPDSFAGLGSPTFYFYPPLAFYLSGFLDLAGLDTWQAINWAGAMTLAGSGFSMWLWVRDKSAHPLGWSVLYMAMPYHLTDFYTRAAVAEFAAFVWLPLIAMGLAGKPRLLAAAFAGLICTHLPMAVLAGAFLIAPVLCRDFIRRKPVAGSILASAGGVALSATYLLPALTLQSYASMGRLWRAGFQPALQSVWSGTVFPHMLASAGAVALLAGISILAARRQGRDAWWSLLALACAGLAMGLLPWIWSAPVLRNVQFAYRLLALAEFAVITGLAGVRVPRAWVALGASALLMAYAFNGLVAYQMLGSSPERNAWIAKAMPDASEYLPPAGRSKIASDAQMAGLEHGSVAVRGLGALISFLALVGLLVSFTSWGARYLRPNGLASQEAAK